MRFIFNKEKGLIIKTLDYKEEWQQLLRERIIYDLVDGEKFLEWVASGCIIDDDGSIANVFVDGYDSNLGLHHKGLSDGGFLVDKDTFLSICKEHRVEVNWANK